MKKQKIIITTLSIFIITLLTIFTVKADYWWLIFNSKKAEKYAYTLLSGKNIKTPDWAIDLIIIKNDNLVAFSNHDKENIFAFSPKGTPSTKEQNWNHIWGNWYKSKNKKK